MAKHRSTNEVAFVAAYSRLRRLTKLRCVTGVCLFLSISRQIDLTAVMSFAINDNIAQGEQCYVYLSEAHKGSVWEAKGSAASNSS